MAKDNKIDIEKIYSGELKITDISLDDMIADAVARKDKEGLFFLDTESNRVVSRKKKNSDETIELDNPINIYRIGYLKRIGFKTKAERNKKGEKQARVCFQKHKPRKKLRKYAVSQIKPKGKQGVDVEYNP